MKNLITLPLSIAALALSAGLSAQKVEVAKMTMWDNVGSFSVSMDETYMVFSQKGDDGKERAFEVSSQGTSWGEAKPIDAINNMSKGVDVGGLFLCEDMRRIYFHAKREGSSSGYDIYYSDRLNGEWGKPEIVNVLSSSADDTYPSVAPGECVAYVLRHQVTSDERKERKEADKMTIHASKWDVKTRKWTRPMPINPSVTFGFVQDARISRDGATLYYSIRKEKGDDAIPFFSRKELGDAWLLPESMTNGDESLFCPQITERSFWYIMPSSRKGRHGFICRQVVPDVKYKQKPIVTEQGKILSSGSGKPVAATINVLDPTTSALVGRYTSKADDGSFCLTLSAKGSYLVDVRSDGYSYAPFMLTYDGSGAQLMPRKIELFDTISLGISVYDAEIFRPVPGKVYAVRQTDRTVFRSVQKEPGRFVLNLPLGSDYNIVAAGSNYSENKFLFKLAGDIIFHHFEREMAMEPLKRNVKVRVLNSVTKADVPADVRFVNNLREETLELKPGQTDVALREGDSYSITVMPPSGYSFKTETFDLGKQKETALNIEVLELAQGASLQLNNILFETGQAFLLPEAYAELDRVVELMGNNPALKMEISAHTDNVGNAAYNAKLSDRRAASVVEYLVENGVPADRLISKGYGMSKPLVPNTSEENRQKNRRVELSVVGEVAQ